MVRSRLRLSRPAILLAALILFAGTPRTVTAAREAIAVPGPASSVSASYGRAVPLGPPATAGLYVVPTRTGAELRHPTLGAGSPLDVFRTPGVLSEAVANGSTVYLFAGERGIIGLTVDGSNHFAVLGSHDGLGDVAMGAFAPSGSVLAAASGGTIHFLRETAPGQLTLLESRAYSDTRTIRRIRARSDSFLVASDRTLPVPSMVLTLYRVRAGAAPESLWEARINSHSAEDLAWSGDHVFIADGNSGVLRFDLPSRTFKLPTTLVSSGKFVRALDVAGGALAAAAEAKTFARFSLGGSSGDSLMGETLDVLSLEPRHLAIVGGEAVISCDNTIQAIEPDEVAQSELEFRELDGSPAPAPVGATGRVRRVLWDAGLAYVADYAGGLRIYRADGADTSLVGVFADQPTHRVYDLAIDRPHHRVYLASGPGGLEIVDVANPAAPAALGSLAAPSLQGLALAVAVIDSDLVVVGRGGLLTAGVTFVDVTNPGSPIARGEVNSPTFQDPRAIAVRDTIAFVADASVGVVSVRFGNPDAPGTRGQPSAVGALDLDLNGNLLLVGTVSNGVQLVDVTQVTNPLLLAQLPLPPVFGVTRQGASAVALLGDAEGALVDITNPARPALLGPISVAGTARDAVWVGDTLLVAASFGLERYRLSPAPPPDPALTVALIPGQSLPRARVSWPPVATAGIAGLDVYRDTKVSGQWTTGPTGDRVNASLLAPSETEVIDDALVAGSTYRYRLEALRTDGSFLKIAEGNLVVPSIAQAGRPYPNPFRPRSGALLQFPFQVGAPSGNATIRVRVFNLAGALVRSQGLTAPSGGGFVTATWDGRNDRGALLPDGIYFIRVTGPGLDASRQFVLHR